MIRIRDIILPFDHQPDHLQKLILQRLGISRDQLNGFTVVSRAIDARRKHRITAVYAVDADVVNESEVLSRFAGDNHIKPSPNSRYIISPSSKYSGVRPVVVGSGPSGMFAALILAQQGWRPVLIERGKRVGARIRDVRRFWRGGELDPESNVQFGEGGAGTFSDGKLTTQIKDRQNRSRKVLEEFVNAGAGPEILYQAKPHIGTENLVKIVRNIRKTIISLGGDVMFEKKLTGIEVKDGRVSSAIINGSEKIDTGIIVLAPGHSARDTFEMLAALGIPIEAKPFSIGVRIEHPQSLIDSSQYGVYASSPGLGRAEYKLVAHCGNGRSAYSFCMCPGGEVISSCSEPGCLVTNGMSYFLRNRHNANSALLVGVAPADFAGSGPLAGVEFQRKWERRAFELGGSNYFAPVQLVGDFLGKRASVSMGSVLPSYTPGVTPCSLDDCLPDFVTRTLRMALPLMDQKLKGFAMPEAVMTALESRSSSPIRIVRNDLLQSPALAGLYPAGEGAGYAGGIMSAAIDGIKIAEAVINAV
ncbi:squalene-associated FAD-dependent desaturase [Limihaloglobus sulfuriphilus]|uniref:Squalene-associated FAD-dependent desaturase n=1 Tax=Limihaloglobus sulfuriphilus TaxID=1851148 RepID=A0A1Q2MBN7_9BACT|nr:NAD(P)-binding protein [Limihaloglobus sulfuriphilus]AQQ70079.1 squalene-associated FAD-dependent desaturase [Limihaloglobus sulfuriphilus]